MRRDLKLIAIQLKKTSSYAINPDFKSKLYKELLAQFRKKQ